MATCLCLYACLCLPLFYRTLFLTLTDWLTDLLAAYTHTHTTCVCVCVHGRADGFNKPVFFSRDYKREGAPPPRCSAVIFSSEGGAVRTEAVESLHTESLGK